MQLVVDSFLSGDPAEIFTNSALLLLFCCPWLFPGNALQVLPVGIKYFPAILNGQDKKKFVAWVTQQNNEWVWVSVPAYLPRHRSAFVHQKKPKCVPFLGPCSSEHWNIPRNSLFLPGSSNTSALDSWICSNQVRAIKVNFLLLLKWFTCLGLILLNGLISPIRIKLTPKKDFT